MPPLANIQPAIPIAAAGLDPARRSAIRKAHVGAIACGAQPKAALAEPCDFARALLPALPASYLRQATVDIANG